MITVTAGQLVKLGKESELEALMADLAAKVRANEPGNVTFEWVRDRSDAQRYLVIEQYTDGKTFDFHNSRQYVKECIADLEECLQERPLVKVYDDAVLPPVSAPPSYFHIGVVVADLEKATARYSDVLGIKFTEPATFQIPVLEDPTPHPATLTAVFSMTAPPYYELIQAEGSGIISESNANRILYFACWEADMAGRQDLLEARSVGIDALFRMDATSTPFAMITAPGLLGARIEYVDQSDRGPIEEWVRTGKCPGGIGKQ